MRQPRVLIATPIVQSKLYVWEEFLEALRAQDADVHWDWLLVDNTPEPDPGYLEWLHGWAASKPFGNQHKIRLKRFGLDADGLRFIHPIMSVTYGERLIWEYFERWSRYDWLFSLECDVLMPPDCLSRLLDSGLPWAASWMTSRLMRDPRSPEQECKIPLLWHSLDFPTWSQVRDWDELLEYGYMEPPTEEPFECVVTHLGCTLIRGDVVRTVPFRLTNAGGDVQYSWDCAASGVQPMCVPIRCDHVAAEERPNAQPPYRLLQEAR
jgi:hypothetical protein